MEKPVILDGDKEIEALKSGIEISFSYRIDEKCPIERGIFPHALNFFLVGAVYNESKNRDCRS